MKVSRIIVAVALAHFVAASACSAATYEGSVKRRGTAEFGSGAESSSGAGSLDDIPESDLGVVGIRFVVSPDLTGNVHVTITRVVKDGPAYKAGIKRGDSIVAVDSVHVSDIPAYRLQRTVRGLPNTLVNLRIRRGKDLIEVSVMRGGLRQLPDRVFQSELLRGELAEAIQERVQTLMISMIVSAGRRASATTESHIPLRNRMVAKEYCDEARFALEQRNYPTAMQHLRKAIKLDPEFSESQLLCGLVAFSLRSMDESEQALKAALALDSNCIEAWRALAELYVVAQKYQPAVDALKNAARISSNAHTEEAIRQRIDQIAVLIANPQIKNVEDPLIVARAAFENQNFELAKSKLTQAIADDATNADAWELLAACHQECENWGEAAKGWKHVSELRADDNDRKAAALYNLASCQIRAADYDNAVATLSDFLKAEPDPKAAFSSLQILGSIFLRQGKFADGLDAMQQAVKADPDCDEAKELQETIKLMDSELATTTISSRQGSNYIRAVKERQLARWNHRKPIKVFIAPAQGVQGYQPAFGQVLHEAFEQWTKESGGKVRFVFVEKKKGANIVCEWVDHGLHSAIRAGETQVQPFLHQIKHADIRLLTVKAKAWQPELTPNAMRTVCLHEIGHALGISAHSGNPDDIMFPSALGAQISERDKNTLLTLYSMKMPNEVTPVTILH